MLLSRLGLNWRLDLKCTKGLVELQLDKVDSGLPAVIVLFCVCCRQEKRPRKPPVVGRHTHVKNRVLRKHISEPDLIVHLRPGAFDTCPQTTRQLVTTPIIIIATTLLQILDLVRVNTRATALPKHHPAAC